MSEAEKKALVMVLRSLINSRKDSNITNLCNDYRDTEGRDIPFQQFKYRNLPAFLLSTGEFVVYPNQTIVAKPSDASEHINKLVAEQNNSKKKRPQRMMAPQRHITSTYSMPQSVYTNAYPQMKYRSPVKYPTHQQQNGYANYGLKNYQKHNNNVQPAQPSRVAQLPPHSNRPKFVVTFDAGMQPANELARAAVLAKSAEAHSTVTPTIVTQKAPMTSSQTKPGAQPVSTTQDLRQVIQERQQNVQETQQPTFKDSRPVLSTQQQIPTRGASKLHDRLKQNPTMEVPVIPQPAAVLQPLIPTAPATNVTSQSNINDVAVTSKLSSRLQRFKSIPTQETIPDEILPSSTPVSPSSSTSSDRSLTTHVGGIVNDVVENLAKLCAKMGYAQPEYKIFAIQTTSRVKGNAKVSIKIVFKHFLSGHYSVAYYAG